MGRFLEEDLGSGDVTTDAIARGERLEARMLCKSRCVVAGLAEAAEVFGGLGATASAKVEEGAWTEPGTVVLEVQGSAESVLGGERLALNIVMRMSGIATTTRELADRCSRVNPGCVVAATRKTTPGFRAYEKRAVVLGGGHPHRSGLYDMVLVKDNHVRLAGSVDEAMRRVKARAPAGMQVEVEAGNLEQALSAARTGADIVMLDNVRPDEGERIAAEVRKASPSVKIEASGGITPENIEAYARWADIVSLGALTHSYKSADFSLEVFKVSRG